MYSQVQLIYNNKTGEYFIADQLFVKYGVDALGNQVVDDIVIIENKLSEATHLTGNQNAASAVTSYTVRSNTIKSTTNGSVLLGKETPLLFKDNKIKWLKTYDGSDGKIIKDITEKLK